jgi:single-stranded-DNA-specific exonuclease
VAALRAHTGLSEPAAQVLALRWDGDDLPGAAQWVAPSLDHLHPPGAMLNMDAAVDRLRSALRRKEKIRVVTDYDVDGTTSSLVLQAALKLVEPQLDVSYHIPSRFDEGYGFSVRAARQAADDGVGLVVTADIGVRDHAAVSEARSRGLGVLVCDHHLPAGAAVPPDAIVLCPPQAGDSYPNRALAACGVSLKLAQALLRDHPKRDAVVRSLLKLAAVGTVADMVSLGTLENRAIVALGLRELARGPHHPGLQALLEVSDLAGARVTDRRGGAGGIASGPASTRPGAWRRRGWWSTCCPSAIRPRRGPWRPASTRSTPSAATSRSASSRAAWPRCPTRRPRSW